MQYKYDTFVNVFFFDRSLSMDTGDKITYYHRYCMIFFFFRPNVV